MYLVAGYFDESYDDETHGQCYTIAGLFGSQTATTSLAMRWKDLNEKWDISYFKASELNAGEGEFKKFRDDPNARGWKAFSPREKELLKQVKTEYTDLIVKADGIYGIGAALVLPDYYKLKQESALARKNLLPPYSTCAQLVLMEAGLQCSEVNANCAPGDEAWLYPIFDSHEDYAGRMRLAFGEFCRKNPICSKFLMPPDYQDEINHRALQAADSFAYEARRYLLHSHFNDPLAPRASMTRLLEAAPFCVCINWTIAV